MGVAGHGKAWCGSVRYGSARHGKAWQALARRCVAWHDWAGRGLDGRGMGSVTGERLDSGSNPERPLRAWFGEDRRGKSRRAMAWIGKALLGKARPGVARRGTASDGLGEARFGRDFRRGLVGQGKAWLGAAWHRRG